MSVEYASSMPSGLTLIPPTDMNGCPSASRFTSSSTSSGDVSENCGPVARRRQYTGYWLPSIVRV